MTKHVAAPGTPQACVEARRTRILERLGQPHAAAAPDALPLPADRLQYLRLEAEELYWNELSWEELTDEERVAGGPLTEMVFPALLALVDGLLVEVVPGDALAPARPHPDAVEEILAFLAERFTALTAEIEAGADSEDLIWARSMTGRLIDLVLYRLYRVSPEEREELDAVE